MRPQLNMPKLTSTILLGLLASSQVAHAHTWIEELMVLAPNGTMVGEPGFPRGNIRRGTPGVNLDGEMVNLIPPGGNRAVNDIQATDLMCKSSQTSQTPSGDSPRLKSPAGQAVALRYQENGHVSLPQNQPGKPDNRGTVYVYGTTQASPDDSFLAIHRQWTPDGSGGDGRGVLLSTANFDDSRCYQVNGGSISSQRQSQYSHTWLQPMGADIWCQQDIVLPQDLQASSTYTLYWVWDWPTMPGTDGFPEGKQEIYTTCMDIDIVDSGSMAVEPVNKAGVISYQYQQGQDLNWAGLDLSDIANPTAVQGKSIAFENAPSPAPVLTSSTAQTIPFSASATGPADGQAASQSADPTVTSELDPFLSIHTISTSGAPGLETQTFSVIPIGVEAPTAGSPDLQSGPAIPQQTDQAGNNGGGRFGGNTTLIPQPTFRTDIPFPPRVSATSAEAQPLPSITTVTLTTTVTEFPKAKRTNIPHADFDNIGTAANIAIPQQTQSGAQGIVTQYYTEYQTVWETALTTIYDDLPTQVKKRAEPTPSCSRSHELFRLKARTPFGHIHAHAQAQARDEDEEEC